MGEEATHRHDVGSGSAFGLSAKQHLFGEYHVLRYEHVLRDVDEEFPFLELLNGETFSGLNLRQRLRSRRAWWGSRSLMAPRP